MADEHNGISALTTIEIDKEDIKFSAAHFTIFSATERERLHGHNFHVSLTVTAPVADDGLCFSYGEVKKRIRALCDELDEYTILAGQSPHLAVRAEDTRYIARFAAEEMIFLQSDTLVLPVRNTTVEEFARYLLLRLLDDRAFIASGRIRAMEIKVSSGPGQRGSARWDAA